ncbi:MAG: hypothetical protein ACFWT6_14145 [Virgibacillus proomii]
MKPLSNPELNLRKTYKTFNDTVNIAAKGLMALGIEKGEHVAIWSDNKPEWLITQFATGKMGAVYSYSEYKLSS